MEIDSDQLPQLVQRLQSKSAEVDPWAGTNHEIFTEIFNLLHPVLRNYALRLTGDRDSAEDLVSETLVKLYQNVNSIDPDKTLSWTIKVLVNLFRSVWRRERRYCDIESVPERELVKRNGETFSDRVLDKVLLQQTLAVFSSFDRKIIEDLNRGHSVIEIAERYGKHRATVYRHIDFIKQILVERIGGETIGEFKVPLAL